VFAQHAAQMRVAERNDVIPAFAPDTGDETRHE